MPQMYVGDKIERRCPGLVGRGHYDFENKRLTQVSELSLPTSRDKVVQR